MFKQMIALLVLSAAVIFSMTYTQAVVHLLINAHDWVSHLLTNVFSTGQAGSLARGLIALLSIPILAGLIPAVLYWMLKRRWFPYFMQIVWVVWLVQAGALAMMYQAATAG